MGTPPSAAYTPGRLAPSLSYAARTPPMTYGQVRGMDVRPYLLSSLCSSRGHSGWRFRRGRQTLYIASLDGSTQRGHHRRISNPPSPGSTVQVPPCHPWLAPPPSPSIRWRRPQPCWRELGTGVALGHDMVHFELKSKVSAGPDHHGQLSPVCLKESDFSGSDLICRENLKASYPTQGIKQLLYDWF